MIQVNWFVPNLERGLEVYHHVSIANEFVLPNFLDHLWLVFFANFFQIKLFNHKMSLSWQVQLDNPIPHIIDCLVDQVPIDFILRKRNACHRNRICIMILNANLLLLLLLFHQIYSLITVYFPYDILIFSFFVQPRDFLAKEFTAKREFML